MGLPSHLGGQRNGNVDLGVVGKIKNDLRIRTLVDIGCGDGVATKAYADLGVKVLGIDGDWTRLPRNDSRFICHDFTTGSLDVGAFDLAYSVEFLEHLEERFLPNVMPIFAASRYAVVTAARPGQRGYHHVNCQPRSYWVGRFDAYGLHFDADYTERLKAASTMCNATEPDKGEAVHSFRQTGMFFRRA